MVVPAGIYPTRPLTSQSPAVKEIDVIFVPVPLVSETGAPEPTVEAIYSPTLPAPAESFVVVPTMPPVVGLKVMLVAVAAPSTGVTNVGDVENTRLVEVVPVVPAAENPVMLLKQVILADEQFVPPCATPMAVKPVVSDPVAKAPVAVMLPCTVAGRVALKVGIVEVPPLVSTCPVATSASHTIEVDDPPPLVSRAPVAPAVIGRLKL